MAKPRLFTVLVLTTLLAITVGGGAVGAKQEASPAAKPLKVAFVYVGTINDGGWTQAQDQGRQAVAAMPNVETAYQESVPDNPADSERVIRDFAQKGYDLIITASFGFMDATINVAKDFPQTVFVHIAGYKTAENVGTAFGKQEEPRYVCGMLAGKMTKSNVIGYVAAFPIPEVIRNINAFTLGAQAVNPNVTVRVVWTNTWFDPQKERAAADALLDGGADVLSQHQDTPAAMQAAEARGAYGCGNDFDMSPRAPKAVLSTPIWHWGVYYTQIVQQVRDGTWEPGQYWGGWKDGIVDLAPIAPFVPADVKAMAEAEAAKFKSGEKTLSTIFTGPIKDQTGAERIPAGTTMSDPDVLQMNWFVAGIEGEIPR